MDEKKSASASRSKGRDDDDQEEQGNESSMSPPIVYAAQTSNEEVEGDDTTDGAKPRAGEQLPATTPGAVAVPGNSAPDAADSNEQQPSQEEEEKQQEDVETQEDIVEEALVTTKTDANANGEAEQSTIMMVEATAIQEPVIATQVIAVPPEPQSGSEVSQPKPRLPSSVDNQNHQSVSPTNLEHVDIDNFDSTAMSTTQQEDATKKKQHSTDDTTSDVMQPFKIVLVILTIIVLYVLVWFIFFGVTVPEEADVVMDYDDSEADDGDDGNDPNKIDNTIRDCIQFIQVTIFHLEKLKAKAWVEFVGAASLGGMMFYYVIEFVQNKYCTSNSENTTFITPKQLFLYDLVVFVIEVLWFFTTVVVVICVRMEELNDPVELILTQRVCIYHSIDINFPNANADGEVFWEQSNPQDQGRHQQLEGAENDTQVEHVVVRHPGSSVLIQDQQEELQSIGDLRTYYVLACIRFSILIFLIVSRGRLLFNKGSCEDITHFWKNCWFWVKIMLEVALMVMTAISLFVMLIPLMEQLEDTTTPWY